MPGGPCFKRGGPLFGGQSLLLRRRRNRPFHHGQEVFLKALSSSLRPCQEASFKLRLEIECNGHKVTPSRLSGTGTRTAPRTSTKFYRLAFLDAGAGLTRSWTGAGVWGESATGAGGSAAGAGGGLSQTAIALASPADNFAVTRSDFGL
jgi:hypothetical protein